jgi:hypothetical protein
MRGTIMASEARPRSAVKLLIERLVPFEQSHRHVRLFNPMKSTGVSRRFTPVILYSAALRIPFVEFGIKGLLSRSMGVCHSTASICFTHSNASIVRLRMASLS